MKKTTIKCTHSIKVVKFCKLSPVTYFKESHMDQTGIELRFRHWIRGMYLVYKFQTVVISVQHHFSFTINHYSLIQQNQSTACTGWGGYWVNSWGKVGAGQATNQAAGSSKAYQQARSLQLHFQKVHGKIGHTVHIRTMHVQLMKWHHCVCSYIAK